MPKPFTSDPALVRTVLENILTAIRRIERRFRSVISVLPVVKTR
jgi:hypothetical protein